MDARKLARLCVELAENRKAENPLVLDVRKLTSVASFFVMLTGSSDPHLRAIRDEIIDRLREDHGLTPRSIDGELRSSWVVLDYSDVIVHIMLRETRERFDLESLWGDAPRVRKAKKSASTDRPKKRIPKTLSSPTSEG